MAIYSYSPGYIEQRITSGRQLRIRFMVLACSILILILLVFFLDPDLPIFREPFRPWLFAFASTLLVAPLFRIVRRWKTWAERTRGLLREVSVEFDPEAVRSRWPLGYQTRMDIREITKVEEPSFGRGLILRTSNRYRRMVIPRDLDGFDGFKKELQNTGVPFVRKTLPVDWDELLFVALFVGTLLCSALANVSLLKINLLASLLLSACGLYILSSNPSVMDSPRLRWSRFGVFLPALFAAIGLWLATRG